MIPTLLTTTLSLHVFTFLFPVNIPHNLEETECNTTITHTLPVGELTAILRITSDYTAELTEGDYIYVRGDYCTIRIHVLQDGKSS